jgi:kinesin family protein 6/9
MKSRIESSEKVITSKLNFVDLAGSERVKKTGSTGITLKEANYINKSLTFLEQVVVSLTDKGKRASKKEHVPYRQSKLTHLLKDSIGGNCRTVMIATVWPEEPYIFETLSTLNFARRMMNVVNEASVNIQLDTNALLKKYQKEIKELKQELAMHNTLANRGTINYDAYTPKEQYAQQVLAEKFLYGEVPEIEFDSVRQAKELFTQCRNLFQKHLGKRDINETNSDNKSNNILNPKTSFKKTNTEPDERVGEVEIKPSFGMGLAHKDARPVNKRNRILILVELSGQNINHLSDNEEERNEKQRREEENKIAEERLDNEAIPDKNTAFLIYKNEILQAKEIETNIHNSTEDLKKRKSEAKSFLEQCNNYKSKIDSLKQTLTDKKRNKLSIGDEMTELIDEEGYKLIDDLKGLKESYKDTLDKFKYAKSEIGNIKHSLDLLKIKYVESFEAWFLKKYGIRIEEHELKLTKVLIIVI